MTPNDFYNGICSFPYKTIGDDVDYFIYIEDGRVILAFQGSTTKTDWKNNLNFPCKIYKNQKSCMLVARGWGQAYKSCNDTVMTEFIEYCCDYPHYTPTIIGHSYGGALAQIACEDFRFRTGRSADLITFGSPKPFFGRKTKKYVKSCCREVKQYSHIHDIVTKLPFFYSRLTTDRVGKSRWKFWRNFNVMKYHLSYGEKTLYKK